jgi:sugar phosphate isomerase/epimerase
LNKSGGSGFEGFEKKFKIGIQPDITHSPRKAFEFARENGFEHVEILMDHPSFHYESLSPAEVLEFKGMYDVEVLIHASSTSTNFLSISGEMRKASYRELEKTLNFARKCEAELVTFHLGWNPGFITSKGFVYDSRWYVEHNYRVLLEEMLPYLRAVNSESLAMENTIQIDDVMKKAIIEILNETDLKLTLDVGHSNIRGHEVFWENFDRVANIHLHDNKGDYDNHLPLGRGNVDLRRIDFANYGGFVTLELREENAIIESKRYLEEHFMRL